MNCDDRHRAAREVAEGHLLERALDRAVDAEHEAARRTGHADRAEGVTAVVGALTLDEVPRPLEHVDQLPERRPFRIAIEGVAAADAAVRLHQAAVLQRL